MLYVIKMTYRIVGVKLVRIARYGARFCRIETPTPFCFERRDWLNRFNGGKGNQIQGACPPTQIHHHRLFAQYNGPHVIHHDLQ